MDFLAAFLNISAPLVCSKHPLLTNLTTVSWSPPSPSAPSKKSYTFLARTLDLRPSLRRISSGAMRSRAMSVSLKERELDCFVTTRVEGRLASRVTMHTSRDKFSAMAQTTCLPPPPPPPPFPLEGSPGAAVTRATTDGGRLAGRAGALEEPCRARETGGTVGIEAKPAPRAGTTEFLRSKGLRDWD